MSNKLHDIEPTVCAVNDEEIAHPFHDEEFESKDRVDTPPVCVHFFVGST